MLAKRWSMVPSSLSSSAEGEAKMDLNILCDIRHPWKMQKKNSCRSSEEEKRKDLEEEEKNKAMGLLTGTRASSENPRCFSKSQFCSRYT